AVAVGDHMGAEVGGGVHRYAKVRVAVGVGFDEDDLAAGAHGAGHVEVERGLLGPAGALPGIGSLDAALVVLGEAAVRGRARRQAVGRPVNAEVPLGVVVAVGVDDRDDCRRDARAGHV